MGHKQRGFKRLRGVFEGGRGLRGGKRMWVGHGARVGARGRVGSMQRPWTEQSLKTKVAVEQWVASGRV